MLKGIKPCISPELLMELDKMGHGDEIVLSDAFFPAYSVNAKVLRADNIKVDELLDGILSLMNSDSYVEHPFIMMEIMEGDTADPAVERDYKAAILKHEKEANIGKIGRFEFYERARKAYLVVVTGENRKYGNILIRKGVTDWK
jgi:Fucose dissimilation pathway protein FucU